MSPAAQRWFPPYRLDPENEQLWRDDQAITLRRKTFEVLRHLVEHAGGLVTKDSLLDAVWTNLAVSDTMPAICVAELRRALGDDARSPRFIETVQRRGYRFIAKVTPAAVHEWRPTPPIQTSTSAPIVVGRKAELDWMQARYAEALAGQRQLVFVSGEPGIGKTTFLRTFLESIAGSPVRIGRGQCIEQYGAGEPYMPVLDTMTRLAREPRGEHVVEVLHKWAPSWLAQMPALLTNAKHEQPQALPQGVTQQRMLREMAEALEALATEAPLILALEDLHWSDFSTLELISVIARRTEPARLMIIATFRPVASLTTEHPLRVITTELQMHHHCEQLRLRLLSERDVGTYLERRFSGDDEQSFEAAAHRVHLRTEGNPLFMVNVVDDLVENGSLLSASTVEPPRTIRQMIEHNLTRLHPEEQQVLEAASVVGSEFSAAAVAAALDRPIPDVETLCARLARFEQFINASGAATWPDGTIASNFRVQHALYKDVLYDRVPAGNRSELHRRVAERLESGWSDHVRDIAAELAHHYEAGGNKLKAIDFFQLAGDEAVRRSAAPEAITHFNAALRLLRASPQTPDFNRLEVALCLSLTNSLVATKGYVAPEIERVCTRARTLAQSLGPFEEFQALGGLVSIYINRGELRTAFEVSEQLVAIAEAENVPVLRMWGHYALGFVCNEQGDLIAARTHIEQSLALYDRNQRHTSSYVQDPGVTGQALLSHLLFGLGYPETARQKGKEALLAARSLGHPYSLAFTLEYVSAFYGFVGEYQEANDLLEEMTKLAAGYGFVYLEAQSRFWIGHARFAQGAYTEGLKLMKDGFATFEHEDRCNADRLFETLHLAEAYGKLGDYEKGSQLLNDAVALVEKSGKSLVQSIIHRLKAQFLLGADSSQLAEALMHLDCAVKVARRQNYKAAELQATIDRARLLGTIGQRKEARTMLAEIYNWFTEGFDTKDLKEAKTLLDELGS